MGATNCKLAEEVLPLIDYVFELQYTLIAMFVITTLVWGSWVWMSPFQLAVGIELMIAEIQLGDAVDCAIKNEIFGPDTAARFKDFSQYYMLYAIGSFVYFVFLDPVITSLMVWSGVFTLGASYVVNIPYWLSTRFGSAFFGLYWTNSVYNAFHPIVAPEVVEAADKAAGF